MSLPFCRLRPTPVEAADAVDSFLEEFDRLAQEQAEAGAGKEAGAEDEDMADAGASGGEEGTGGGRRAPKRQRQQQPRGEAGAPPPQRPQIARPFVPLRRLQRLSEALSQARGASAVALLDAALLGRLLAALEGHVEVGLDRAVADGEQASHLEPGEMLHLRDDCCMEHAALCALSSKQWHSITLLITDAPLCPLPLCRLWSSCVRSRDARRTTPWQQLWRPLHAACRWAVMCARCGPALHELSCMRAGASRPWTLGGGCSTAPPGVQA
jgi:hypothetical protein